MYRKPTALVPFNTFANRTNNQAALEAAVRSRSDRPVAAVTRMFPADPVAMAAAQAANNRNALINVVGRLARRVNQLEQVGGNGVALAQPGQLGMYSPPDADGKGGVVPFPVITIPSSAAADNIIEVELPSDSVARGLLTDTILEYLGAVVGGGLAGEEVAQSAIELTLLINNMTMREFFRVPLDSCIPTAYGPQPIPVHKRIAPDVQLIIQARILDDLALSGDGTIRLRGWSGNGTTYNRHVSVT